MILLLLLLLVPDGEGELNYEVAEARIEVADEAIAELTPPEAPVALPT